MRMLSVVAAVVALAGPARSDALHDALAKLQERYDTTKTLAADFTQIVESKTLAGTLESKGKLWFEKPNRMRWDYQPPDRQLIIGDGETLWIYQPDDKQVIKAALDEAFQARTPTNFLAGLGHVDRDFDAALEADEAERWVLRLVPKTDKTIGTLTLLVRKTDASIEEARVADGAGTVTRLRLTHEQRNLTLAADLFHFTPPPGVDVVRPPTY
jgi:outer membrane lipoprotein carrier protein